jgi:hypothetical protein
MAPSHHWRADGVGVMKLHDTTARPTAGGPRPGVAIHQSDRMAAPRQRSREEQTGRTGPYCGDAHGMLFSMHHWCN